MIDQLTVDRILQTAQITDVVGEFVSLRKRGVNMIGLCPFHDEKTPSFTVSPAKNICKCFGCGKGGSPVNFIMEHEHLSYYDALRYLAKKYHIEIVEKEVSADELNKRNERESLFVLNTYAQTYFEDVLWKKDEGKAVGLSYFKERGFREDVIKKFGLGYSIESYDAFARVALEKGYKRDYLLKTGLCTERQDGNLVDRFRGRVIFPVHTLSGKVVAFGGRILKTEEKAAKYVNSPESEIYHKSNELYGLFFAKQSIVKNDNCFLVEGYTDVLSMYQSGIENVVSSSGTALTTGQIRLIRRFTPNITVLYDGDAAGVKASIRGIDLLLEEGMNVKVVLLPEGEDPDSFAKKQDASDFIHFIEQNQTDFIHFKSQLLLEDAGKDVVKKAKLITDIVQSIAIIPDAIMRSVYVKECAKRFEMNENVLFSEVNKKRNMLLESESKRTNEYAEAEDINVETANETFTNNAFLNYTFLQEQNLIACMLRSGANAVLVRDEAHNEYTISIFDLILNDLAVDDLDFSYPLHKQICTELIALHVSSQEEIEFYFLNHPNQQIRAYVFDLITDKHSLSKVHQKYKALESEQDKLNYFVTKYLLDYKEKIVDYYCQELRDKIKHSQGKVSDEEMDYLMQELTRYNAIRKFISKQSGEKTVIRL
jgi:DNA primase